MRWRIDDIKHISVLQHNLHWQILVSHNQNLLRAKGESMDVFGSNQALGELVAFVATLLRGGVLKGG